MKKALLILLSLVLLLSVPLSVTAKSSELVPIGEKVIFTDENWAYEKVNVYGWELDEYIGSDSVVSFPWAFAKEYITSVGSYAFNNNQTITDVTTTGKIESIGDYAFNNCSALESIELYDSLTALGVGCFYGCGMLNDINLEDTSITAVSAYCFANCGFSEVALPDSCLSIENMAFYNCDNLTRITIPATVTSIHQNAFMDCDNLVVYCYKDSAAHQFALDKSIPFVLIDDIEPTEAPTELPTVPETYILGDVDDDDDVSVIDVTLILRYCAEIKVPVTYEMLLHGDVDGDGDVSPYDATLILRFVADINTPYPIGEEVTGS